MESPMTLAEMEGLVADPATSAEKLRLIAYFAPSLRAAVVDHPNTYPGLLDWLEEVGGPEVAARVAERRAAGSMGAPGIGELRSDEDTRSDEEVLPDGSALLDGDALSDEGAASPDTGDANADTPEAVGADTPEAVGADTPDALIDESPESAGEGPSEEVPAMSGPESVNPDEAAGPAEDSPLSGPAEDGEPEDALHPLDEEEPVAPAASDQATLVIPAQHLPEEGGALVDRRSIFSAAASRPSDPAFVSDGALAIESSAPAPSVSPASQTPAFTPLGARGENLPDVDEPPIGGGSRDRRFMWILIVLVGALLALLGYLFFGSSRGAQEAPALRTQSDSDAAAQSLQPAASAPALGEDSPQSDQPQSAILFPVRPDARTMPGFSAPSGNIVCFLGDDEASCKIAETSWEGTSFQTCEGDEGVGVLSLEGSRAGASCAALDLGHAPVLDYGEYAKNGNVACVSTQDGISCWNQVTGRAFALARGGWRIAEGGEIGPDAFTW